MSFPFFNRSFIYIVGIFGMVYFCSRCMAADSEVRGTWITTTGNDEISTPANTPHTMRRLREIGLNTVYIECWKNGYTEFPSETMQKLIGIPFKVNAAPPQLQRDLLQEAVIEAHRNGLAAIAWFEYGFMAAYKTTDNPLRKLGEKEGWLLRQSNGELVGKQNDFVWMNPLHPKAQEILLGIALDAARKYDLDGIQLDDRISMPTEMGYDDFTKALYAKDHGGEQPPVDNKDPDWIKWRADQISAFAMRFAAALHKINAKLIVSASPAPYPWSYENYACDWPVWMKWTGGDAWDECIPQNYRLNASQTKASIAEGLPLIGNRRGDLLAGIRIVGDGPDMSVDDLLDTIRYTRQSKMGGHVLWFSRGVLDLYSRQLKDFYNVSHLGTAPRPGQVAGWRTDPIVATKTADGTWNFSVQTAGKYQIIEMKKGVWSPLAVQQLPAGGGILPKTEASDAIELLPDRRP